MRKFTKIITFIFGLAALIFCSACKSDPDDTEYYKIYISDIVSDGNITFDKKIAKKGETVIITATANEGYQLKTLSATDSASNDLTITYSNSEYVQVTVCKFTMPESNVAVTAEFEKKSSQKYSIEVSEGIENGSVSVSKTSAEKGSEIILTADPADDYMLKSFIVTDENGKEVTVIKLSNNYYFRMPGSKVNVSASFTEASAILDILNVKHAAVSVDKTNPVKGDTVTITVTPETDAVFSAITVSTDRSVLDISETTSPAENPIKTFTFTMPKTRVTITASINWNYTGEKGPSVAKAVGDIVFSDGSATEYSEKLTLTSDQKNSAVAVIFYDGSGTLGTKPLGIGLRQAKNLSWTEAKDFANKYGSNYNTNNQYKNGWIFPSIEQLTKIRDTENSNKKNISKACELCGGFTLKNEFYWSSTTDGTDKAKGLTFDTTSEDDPKSKDSAGNACAIHEFTPAAATTP